MRNISLLPAGYKNYRRSEKRINRFAIIAAVLILAFVVVYASLSLYLVSLQSQSELVRRERELVQLRAAQLQSYEDMKVKISDTDSLYEQIMKGNPDWSSLLVQVFNSIPQGLRLDSFTIDYPQNDGVMNMRGWADSHGTVAYWISLLKENDNLSNVLYKSSSAGMSANSSTDNDYSVQFEISAELLGVKAFDGSDNFPQAAQEGASAESSALQDGEATYAEGGGD